MFMREFYELISLFFTTVNLLWCLSDKNTPLLPPCAIVPMFSPVRRSTHVHRARERASFDRQLGKICNRDRATVSIPKPSMKLCWWVLVLLSRIIRHAEYLSWWNPLLRARDEGDISYRRTSTLIWHEEGRASSRIQCPINATHQ